MSATATPNPTAAQAQAPGKAGPPAAKVKQRAAIVSLLAAALITALKLATGLLTGSLGMLSEAAHSGVDLLAAGMTVFSIRIADQPADEEHAYGHGKVESLSAFAEGGLMLVSSVWIIYEAAHRIVFHNHLSLPLTPWPFLVLGLSIAIDISRSRRLKRIASEHRSDALAADATHFSTDIWSSLAVLLGLGATALGERLHWPGLELADPVAALLVSALILTVAWRLARQTAETLLDATPAQGSQTAGQTRRKLLQDLRTIDGVIAVNQLRTRRSGSGYFADLTLAMPRNLSFQRAEQITQAATEVIRQVLPAADVVVHSVPTATEAESVHDRIRAVAARSDLSLHDVSVQQLGANLNVDQHLEVPESMTLREAHELVTRLETEMRREIPAITTILTHIESEPATIERSGLPDRSPAFYRRLEQVLREVAAGFPQVVDTHDVHTTRHGDRLQVSCHCTLRDEMAMGRVHEVITEVEHAFRLRMPEVSRLLIHPEPATDNRR